MPTTDFVKVIAPSCQGCNFDGNLCREAPLADLIKQLDEVHGNCCGRIPHIYVLTEDFEAATKAVLKREVDRLAKIEAERLAKIEEKRLEKAEAEAKKQANIEKRAKSKVVLIPEKVEENDPERAF
jgi:hypothetical protein